MRATNSTHVSNGRDWLNEAAECDQLDRAELERARGVDLACWRSPAPCDSDVVVGGDDSRFTTEDARIKPTHL
jgi:hypothetical protein